MHGLRKSRCADHSRNAITVKDSRDKKVLHNIIPYKYVLCINKYFIYYKGKLKTLFYVFKMFINFLPFLLVRHFQMGVSIEVRVSESAEK